ncbi:unnamed protein product, partial [Musa acuminata var. zebrina]
MEDYGFEYSDEEPEEQDVDIENQYYNSKGLVETDPEEALAGFAEVVCMEPEKAEWGFKALKQTVKLYYRLGKYKEMMTAYREMLTYIKSAVTRNYSEKCINNIMDFVSGSANQNFGLLQEFYETTLKALEEAKNERLWFKTNLKLCTIWFDMGEYGRMGKILKELHKSCRREDGTDDQTKGTQLLESNRRTIMDDPFIRNYIEDLLKNIRTQVLLKLIKPYTRIRIPFISKELNVPEKDVEQLLVSLILDNHIQGHIDQVNRVLERSDR